MYRQLVRPKVQKILCIKLGHIDLIPLHKSPHFGTHQLDWQEPTRSGELLPNISGDSLGCFPVSTEHTWSSLLTSGVGSHTYCLRL